jgi:hypothetical protein
MPTFEITTPNGTFEVTAPDEQSALSALQQAGEMDGSTAPQQGVAEDVTKAGASGLARGTADLMGLPGTIGGALEGGLDWLKSKGYETVTGATPEPGSFFSAEPGELEKANSLTLGNPLSGPSLRGTLSNVTGGATDYKAKTTPGKYAGTIGEFVPSAAAFGGGTVANTLLYGALPGAASEAAGQATEGTPYEPYARAGAALLAPSAANLARRAVTPFPASPERLRQADNMANEGVNLTAGQRTGSERLRYMESELGGVAGARAMDQQGEQFTRAVLRRAGVNADRATPEVIDHAFARIGQQFDDLAARNNLVADRQLLTDLRHTTTNYGMLTPQASRAPIVENLVNDIVGTIRQHNGIPGASYQALRSRLDRMARGAAADPQLSTVLREMRNDLDDAMERTLAQTNPNDIQAWREARNQYRNMIVIERAATGAGENAAAGLISPSALRNATVSQHGRRNYARGNGDFAELARAGEATMKPLPNSGTASRTSARNLGAGLSSVLGGGVGATFGPIESMAGVALGAAAPAAVGRAMLSRPGRAYLGNQLMPGQGGGLRDLRTLAILQSLNAQRNVPESRR